MPGALLQLVAYPASDIYMTGNPQSRVPYGIRNNVAMNSNPTCPTLDFAHYPFTRDSYNGWFGVNNFSVDAEMFEKYWGQDIDNIDYEAFYRILDKNAINNFSIKHEKKWPVLNLNYVAEFPEEYLENDDEHQKILPWPHLNYSTKHEKLVPIVVHEYNPDVIL